MDSEKEMWLGEEEMEEVRVRLMDNTRTLRSRLEKRMKKQGRGEAEARKWWMKEEGNSQKRNLEREAAAGRARSWFREERKEQLGKIREQREGGEKTARNGEGAGKCMHHPR